MSPVGPRIAFRLERNGWAELIIDAENGARLSAADGPGYGEEEMSVPQVLRLPRRFSVSFSSPDPLAAALLHAAEAVEADHGQAGYCARWTGAHGFPVRGVAALRAALAAPPSERLDYGG
jgi:hypothetical protein